MIRAGLQFKWAFHVKNKSTVRHSILLALLVVFIPLANAKDAADEKMDQQCGAPSMKEATGSHATGESRNACAQLLVSGKPGTSELPPGAFEKLDVHAGFGWGIFSGTLYNGNSDYAVTSVTVRLTPTTTGNGKSDGELPKGNEYDIELSAQPLSKTALSMPIPSDNTLEYSWKIVKAKGYKTR